MNVSWSSISAGAMTAAVSLGSSVQAIGAGAAAAAHALPQAAATLPHALPQAVSAGAATSAQLATDLTVVEKPARAIAGAAPKSSFIVRATGFLSKALPIVTIGASALAGASIVNDKGAQALVTTKEGRGAVLGALGGAFLLVPHPAAQLAAAGALGAVAANHFGGLDRLDHARIESLPGAAPT